MGVQKAHRLRSVPTYSAFTRSHAAAPVQPRKTAVKPKKRGTYTHGWKKKVWIPTFQNTAASPPAGASRPTVSASRVSHT